MNTPVPQTIAEVAAASDPGDARKPVRIYSAAEIHDLFKTESIYGAEEFVSDVDYREMQNLLSEARFYVSSFYTQTEDDESNRDALLTRIDQALPSWQSLAICGVGDCVRAAGHDGDHDAVPF